MDNRFSAVWQRGFISTICLKVASGGGILFRIQIEISTGVWTLRLDRVRFPWCVSLFTGPLCSLQRSSSARMKIISAGDLLTPSARGWGGGWGKKKNIVVLSFSFSRSALVLARLLRSCARRKKKVKNVCVQNNITSSFFLLFYGTVWQSVENKLFVATK